MLDGTARTIPRALRVLLVEDDVDVLAVTTMLLECCNHLVCAVSTGEEALRVLQSERYDVLLTDVRLPGCSGLELAAEATKRCEELRVIFASGYGDDLRLREVPGALVLHKPYDLSDIERVFEALESR